MIRPAFSTVACPHWPLRDVAARADEYGYECVELRTFGDDSRLFACDPALSSPAKTRELFRARGVEIACLATSLGYDQIIGPPVLGPTLFDQERSVRETRRAIDLAVALDCPFVRVFGFRISGQDTRKACIARIAERLTLALDHANKTGVRVVIENAGSFATSADLLEIISACDHPLLGACYSNAAALLAGENPVDGVRALGGRLWVARVRDAAPMPAHSAPADADGADGLLPCELGAGTLRAQVFADSLHANGFAGPLVFEHDFAWLSGLGAPETVLPAAAKTMFQWIGLAPRADAARHLHPASPTHAHHPAQPARAGR